MTEFRKTLAKYYRQWAEDCRDSARFCEAKGALQRAKEYSDDAKKYAKIIRENEEAIEFFSQGDNAYKLDRALPEKFRGYK